jgi:flagellar biogenesis protein FliO
MPPHFWAGYVLKLALTALVLGALYLIARRLRTMRFLSRRARCVNLVETTLLTPGAALHVVTVGSRHYLLGSATGGVSSLAELDPGDVEATR